MIPPGEFGHVPTYAVTLFGKYLCYAILALALDLTLRQDYPGLVTLDDYMKQMWRTHGLTERPYEPQDLETGLARVTGDPAFAHHDDAVRQAQDFRQF